MDEANGHEAVPKGRALRARAAPERLAQTIITITTTNEAANGTGNGRNAKREACPKDDRVVRQAMHGRALQPRGSVLQHHAIDREHLETTLNVTPVELRTSTQKCQWLKPALALTTMSAFWEPRDRHARYEHHADDTQQRMSQVSQDSPVR